MYPSINLRIIYNFIYLIIFILFFPYIGISVFTNKKNYDNINNIPFNNIGVILGTSKYVNKGNLNLYFKYRIDAAILLYRNNKIKYFIVSGNREPNYNEPRIMEQELIKKGIPYNHIYKDYAGLRTLDSIFRTYKIFGKKNFTIISQKFHNERAIFIANNLGLKVIGYNAITPIYRSLKSYIREYLARIRAILDISYYYIFICTNNISKLFL